jgi:endo-1,4-beta-xylanase
VNPLSPTRRQLLAAAGTLALPLPASAAPSSSLHAAAQRAGLRFGSCFADRPDRASFRNHAYAALLEAECGILVPENEMKWQHLRPIPDRFDFAAFDAMVGYAGRHGMALRGHTLLWHQPKWMPRWEAGYDFGTRPATAAARLLGEHIATVCRRYGRRITAYDVVNEAVNPDDGSLYETNLSRALGGAQATLDLAFHTAREAAPHAQLVYNDYMGWEPGNERHRAGVLRLLEGCRRRSVPVDALGVQSHLITQGLDTHGSAAAYQGEWRRFLDAVTAMGYALVITELDVRDDGLPADPLLRDRAAADFVRAYLDLMLDYPQLRDVLVWGMTDRFSWVEGFKPRRDGAPRRPCPYDAAFRPKPMRAALMDAFAARAGRG